MPNRHEPDSEFVERLRRQIESEIRRRDRFPDVRSGKRRGLTLAALMLLSMGVGAAVTAAAYQAADDARLERLVSAFEIQAGMASDRLELANAELAGLQRDLELGMVRLTEVFEANIRVAAAEAALETVRLDLEEARIMGREPLDDLAAPLVGGRDFVSERLRIDRTAAEAALRLEVQKLAGAERRLELGLMDVVDIDRARARVVEIEAAVDALRRKLEVRGQVLGGEIGDVEAGLRGLEIETEQRLRALEPRVGIAESELDLAEEALRIGTGDEVAIREARLRRLQAETGLVEAEIELARVRRQLGEQR